MTDITAYAATDRGQDRYDETARKLTVIVSTRLDDLTVVNTVGHIAVAIGAASQGTFLGSRWRDASGVEHSSLAMYPFILLTAKPGKIREVVSRARTVDSLICVDYPEEGYTTTNDLDYGAALSGRNEISLVYIGAGLFGPTEQVKELCSSFSLWRPRSS